MNKDSTAHVGNLYLEMCALRDRVEQFERFIMENANQKGTITFQDGVLKFVPESLKEAAAPSD